MNEALIVALVAVAFAAAFFIQARDRKSERASADAREKQLLDRLMSRDFSEYRTLTHQTAPRPAIRQMVGDEEEAEEDERRRRDVA